MSGILIAFLSASLQCRSVIYLLIVDGLARSRHYFIIIPFPLHVVV